MQKVFLQSREKVLNVLYKIPLEEFSHEIVLKLFHEYAIIGGMPEVIKTYIERFDEQT